MDILFKLKLDFVNRSEAVFGTKAEFIVTSMTTEPMLTLVPNPLPAAVSTRVEAIAALADYKAAALVAADGSRTAIKDRDQKRAILEGILQDWAPHLELTAKKAGDITILEQSQYVPRQPSVKLTRNGVPDAPIITVKRGTVSGSVVARAKPLLPHVNTYEGEYAVGDSVADANFHPGVIAVAGSRIMFTGLEVAKLHQIRVRGIGSTGPGDWSDLASIIVT